MVPKPILHCGSGLPRPMVVVGLAVALAPRGRDKSLLQITRSKKS